VHRRQLLRAGLGAGVVAAAGAAAASAIGFGGRSPDTQDAPPPPAVSSVVRATLTRTERVRGVLGYGSATTVVARPGSAGTITWLAPVGAIVRPGQAVYKVDEFPVVLIAGSVPPFRRLAVGERGRDVAQLEQNLRRFGYGGFTADDRFTASTAQAVRAWQRKLGRPRTGEVEADHLVVAAGPVRIIEHRAPLGTPAVGPVLAHTGTTRLVTIALEVTRRHLVREGQSGEVILPDASTVTGVVSRVGTVATASSDGVATVEVVVMIANQTLLGGLDGAPVDLTLTVDRRDNVLTVPVGALVALTDGGYGVQVVDGRSSQWVRVQTGMFANGRVEVSGIAEGTPIGVPQ